MLGKLWVPAANTIGLFVTVLFILWLMNSKRITRVHVVMGSIFGIVLSVTAIIGGFILHATVTSEYAVLSMLWFGCYLYALVIIDDMEQYKLTVEPAKDVRLAQQKVFQTGGIGILISVVCLLWSAACVWDVVLGVVK